LTRKENHARTRKVRSATLIMLIPFCFYGCWLQAHEESARESANNSGVEARELFVSQLRTWTEKNDLSVGDSFQLDRRFAVISCASKYDFTRKKNSSVIKASCRENNWSKHINLQVPLLANHLKQAEKPKVTVWVLKQGLKRGSKVELASLFRKSVHKHLAPRNYWKRSSNTTYYARVALRPNKILTESDLYQAKKGLVAATSIPIGTQIDSDMVVLKEIVLPPNGEIFSELSQLQYFETNKNLKVGSAILFGDLKKTKLVKRGEQVIVRAGGFGFEIRSRSKALKDGYFGDQITLSSSGGFSTFTGRVTGKNLVTALK